VSDPGPSDPSTGKRPIRVARPADREGRPDILLGPNTHKTTAAMVAALRHDLLIYQRAGQLVHVVRSEDTDEDHAPGSPIVRTMPVSFATDRLSEHARCLALKDEEWKHVAPPRDSVRAVLERGSWAGIRTLDGVIESPSMRPDGSILQEPGYDRKTRSLYEPREDYPRVPSSPTQSDAAVAYAHLADVFADFPYVDESHRSAAVSAVLTVLARTAILGAVPCWLFDASTSRSGKSLQVDVISLIATGRPAPRMTFPETDEELEKVLAGYALSGARVVNFDNVARAFGGAAIDKCITATDTVQLRVLGTQEMPVLPWRAVVLASGNNVYAKGDMLARVLCPRLESPLENPETRDQYTHPDRGGEDALCLWTRAHRRELVVDALTLLRAYHIAGRPAQPVPRFGGFGAWRTLVAQALVWAGAPDPLGARRGLGGDDDPQRANEAALVAGWALLCREHGGGTGLTASAAVSHLYPPPRRDEPPDGHDGLRESIQGLTGARPGFPPATDRLSRALRKLKARPLNGQKLMIDGKTGGSVRWSVHPSKP
jgi:putative DNA primase/helicase